MMLKKLLTLLSLSISLGAGAQQLPGYVPSRSLVSWWPFTQNANDFSGNGFHGMVYGAQLTADRFGVEGAAYAFNGLSDYIRVPATNVTVLDSFTVSAWVFYAGDKGPTPYDTYFMFGDRTSPIPEASAHSFDFAYHFTGQHLDNYQPCKSSSFTNVNLGGRWHHVVNMHQATLNKIYVDAVLIDSIVSTTAVCYHGTNSIWFGSCPPDGQYMFGKIDDVGFWTRALNEQEVSNLYHATTLSVATPTAAASISVFPNPNNGSFAIKGSVGTATGAMPFQIMNALGQIIAIGQLQAVNGQVNEQIALLGNPASGIYSLSVAGPQGMRNVRLQLTR